MPCRNRIRVSLQDSGIISTSEEFRWFFDCSNENITVGDYNVKINFSKNMLIPAAEFLMDVIKLIEGDPLGLITDILLWDPTQPIYEVSWSVSKLDCVGINYPIVYG